MKYSESKQVGENGASIKGYTKAEKKIMDFDILEMIVKAKRAERLLSKEEQLKLKKEREALKSDPKLKIELW